MRIILHLMSTVVRSAVTEIRSIYHQYSTKVRAAASVQQWNEIPKSNSYINVMLIVTVIVVLLLGISIAICRSYMLSLTECVWEFRNNAFWDTC